ncbi:MAG: molybdopterin-guanine dinucleotide biosynthesis protein B [Nitrospiraceae bacterium]|nr:MAG: molybdopterin-guanine dinucleotide biosynthesis protein B [Nitrospiraceae bacterium]
MIPIISVVGKSNVGKTTLLEKLLIELKKRGYRVATIKHDVHGFNIDQPGKDTWRHAQAGADTVIISSPAKVALISRVEQEKTLDQVAAMAVDVDIIFTEGYKQENKPKIEVFRSGVYDELLCEPHELIAIASDLQFDNGVPCFGLDDAAGLVDLIEKLYMKPGLQR